MVASAVGGIQDQIEDGVSGLLIRDATDLASFADKLCELLCHADRMEALAAAGRARRRLEARGGPTDGPAESSRGRERAWEALGARVRGPIGQIGRAHV